MATIGYDSTTGVGGVTSATTVNHWVNYEHPGEQVTASSGEYVMEVGFHHEGSTAGSMQIGVYRKDTLELIGEATVAGSGGAGRKTTAVNWPLTAGVEYIVGFRIIANVSQYRSSAAGSYGRYSAATGASALADPFVVNTVTTHRFAVFATTAIAAGDTITVDSESVVGTTENVTLLFDEAYVIPVTAASGVIESDNIPFIYTAVGIDSAGVAAGQNVNILVDNSFVLTVEEAASVIAGQEVSLNSLQSITVDAGFAVFQGSDVALVVPFVTSGTGNGRRSRKRCFTRLINFGR